MRISDWSSDVCSSDLARLDGCHAHAGAVPVRPPAQRELAGDRLGPAIDVAARIGIGRRDRTQVYDRPLALDQAGQPLEYGRASCRERECQSVSIAVVASSFKNKHKHTPILTTTHTP